MTFRNRNDAGMRLASALRRFKDSDAVVYAIPRGGIPVGVTVAEELSLPFDICVASRINDPDHPGYPVAVMTADHDVISNDIIWNTLDANWLNWAVGFAERDVERKQYVADGRAHISATGRTAIIVDEGATTGLAMRAALRAIRKQAPRQIVVGLPVASVTALRALSHRADMIFALESSGPADAIVATHYNDYRPLSDREVEYLLGEYDVHTKLAAESVAG